jgi:hypothetical protein
MEPEAPPAVSERRTEHHKTTVLVPLYYYPVSDKTWQPLHDVYVLFSIFALRRQFFYLCSISTSLAFLAFLCLLGSNALFSL